MNHQPGWKSRLWDVLGDGVFELLGNLIGELLAALIEGIFSGF